MKQFKSSAASVMAAMIVLQSLSLLYVQCEFNINQAYIARVLCINRDKPQMHCDGKCYLKKEIDRNAEKENSHQKEISSYTSITLFFYQPSEQVIYPAMLQIFKDLIPGYFSSGFRIRTDHPPTV
ncbi:MAG: hypothetical protein IPO83_17460 [Chitinophagaceae bacterium]|nr:hypothetical protein [Chitinophagaceae bacterium]